MQDQHLTRRDVLTATAVTSLALNQTSRADETTRQEHCSNRPLAQNYSVIHHRKNPRNYVEGCGLLTLQGGDLLAVVPVVPRGGVPKKGVCTVLVYRSSDQGKTWRQISELPYYSAVPFLHNDDVYLFLCTMGKVSRNDDLQLVKSTDGGRTWSEPVTLFKGHFWNCQTGIVQRENRIYWGVDDLYGSTSKRSPRAIVGNLDEPMNPSSWRMSNLIPYPGVPGELQRQDWSVEQDRLSPWPDHWLEPNIIEVDGHLKMMATVKYQRQTSTNLCALFDITDDDQELKLKFKQFYPMPGGHLKFAVIYDAVSRLFWATANLAVDSQETLDIWKASRRARHFTGSGGNDRRMLMLLYSLDALNWFQAGCIARAESVRQSFMYTTPAISNADLVVVSRTSSGQASDQHDADLATCHRVKNFRSLALNLHP